MSKKKKLLHIVECMGGGVFTYIVDLSNKLCDEYDVYVAYGIREQTPKNYLEYFDQRIHLIKVENFVREIQLNKDIPAILEIRKIVKEVKPDIIHLHSSKAGVMGRMFIGNDYKKFYTPHGYSFLMEDISRAKRNVYYIIEKIMGKRSCTTIACGPGEYEETMKLTKDAVCISNGIDLESVKADIEKSKQLLENMDKGLESKRKKQPGSKLFEEGFTVITLGRICEQKNPKLFNEIAKELPEVDFVWIGDGDQRDVLTADNIEVTGWLERDEALLRAMQGDVFILTSLWEGLPISLLEAMYLKKLCIVSNVIGNKDVIIDDLNGYVCSSVLEFTEAIKYAMSDNNDNERLTERAYRDLKKHYNSNEISEKYKKVYQK